MLDCQLKGWIERLLGEMKALDIATERADSKAKLQNLLDADFRGLIVAMIHKFEAIRKHICMRDNVFVFIDEAHRSVAKDLGTYMMAAVPRFKIFGKDDERVVGRGAASFRTPSRKLEIRGAALRRQGLATPL